jgi:hypothetical protein
MSAHEGFLKPNKSLLQIQNNPQIILQSLLQGDG